MKPRWRWLVLGFLSSLAVLLLLMWLWLRIDPHVETVLTADYQRGATTDEVAVAELEAAGPHAVEDLRTELRRRMTWFDRIREGALDWLKNRGFSGLDDPLLSPKWTLPRRKRHALNALLLLGDRAASARPELEALLSDPTEDGSVMAASVLFALRPNDPATISNAVARLRGSGQSERFFLSADFAKIWTNPPPHLSTLVASLKDSDEGVRAHAVQCLGRYGQAVSNVVPELLPLLHDPSPQVRPRAAYALGHIAPREASRAIDAMLAEQEFNDPRRTNVGWIDLEPYRLYAELGPVARAAIPRLEEEFANRSFLGRRGPIAFALWRVAGDNSARITDALAEGSESRIQRFQLLSLRGLREIGPPASNAVPALERLTHDHRVLIRQMAQDALQAITKPPLPAR